MILIPNILTSYQQKSNLLSPRKGTFRTESNECRITYSVCNRQKWKSDNLSPKVQSCRIDVRQAYFIAFITFSK